MKNLFFSLLYVLFAQFSFGQEVNKLLSDYLQLKDALVVGDNAKATNATNTFYSDLKAQKTFKEKTSLLKLSEKMVASKSLDDKRKQFNTFSLEVWKLVKNANSLKQTVYFDYCPMEQAYWLSTEAKIQNPYLGKEMLMCGDIVKTKQP